MDLKRLQETPQGRELVRRLNFNMLLLNCVDTNSTEILNLMQALGVYKGTPKSIVNKLRTLMSKLVTGIDKSLESEMLQEGFGEVGEYLFKVMDEAEKIKVPQTKDRVLRFINYCQRIHKN